MIKGMVMDVPWGKIYKDFDELYLPLSRENCGHYDPTNIGGGQGFTMEQAKPQRR